MKYAVTWDYLCPFARNANEAIVDGLREGRDWDVSFQAFSLSEVHTEEGETPVWDRDELPSGVRALAWGVAIRDEFPESFLDAHVALFAARHDAGLDINDEAVLRDAVAGVGLDPDAVADVVATGAPLKKIGEEHTAGVEDDAVFGVPTFITDGEAVFVRMMTRHDASVIDRVLQRLPDTDINEFKRTRVPR